MSRAVIFDAILSEPRLQAMGFDQSNVKVNYDSENRPSDKMFINLVWGEQNLDQRMKRGPRQLVIWVHMYREFSTDYVRIDNVIEVLDDVLPNILDTPGADGQTLTCVEERGSSRDRRDSRYNTLCRSASYDVLSRKT